MGKQGEKYQPSNGTESGVDYFIIKLGKITCTKNCNN